ncbi:glycerol-3-phosphate acyltransferase ATS12, chloroplastic [Cryptomeria japonica]|uniref:glycerol-3-phosphate acyltransferase ATS12, chloroplastic n=1 Tax=Cryptomeria japonica TaxID=3369 RepID=UPI0027DA35A0|nr:glycerol-3-phosphate acyltransferase ATS12, chloroplastic [Cryptomeria japonica]
MAAFWSAAGGSAAVSCLKSGGTVKSVAEVPNLRPLRRQRQVVVAYKSCPHLNFSCNNNNIKLKIKAMAEHKGGAEQVLARPRKAAVAEAHGSDNNDGTPSRTCLSEEELFLSMKKKIEAKRLPASAAAAMEDVYRNYQNAVFESGNPNANEIVLSNMAIAFDRILLQFEDPFTFSNYHRAIREPFDYYMFGQNYIRPLIDFRNSYVGNLSVFHEMEKLLMQGHNIVLISNHQSEADPAVIALMLETTNPLIAERITYVAGDRVVLDPVCKPFSMGRNLLCVYSKKHINDIPELAEMKRKANTRTLKEMALLLRKGSQLIWIAPSGGRDRPHPVSKDWFPAPFDDSSADNMRRLLENSGVPGHIYPLALLSHDIMPPPLEVEKEIGEKRKIGFHGVGISAAPEIRFTGFSAGLENQEKVKEDFSKAIYDTVVMHYNVLKSAIYGGKGVDASSSFVSLCQPWMHSSAASNFEKLSDSFHLGH